jgi:hypothetical protein
MDDPERQRSEAWSKGRRSPLASPLVTLALAVVVLGLGGAILFVPGLLPSGSATPSTAATPTACAGSAGCTASPSASGTPSTPPASPTPALPSFVRPTPTPLPTFLAYVVKSGDSLGTIAKTYATTARSIAWWNRGTYPSLDPESPNYSPNHIEPGWTLVLIPGTVVDDANPPTPSPAPPTPTPGPSTPGPSAS